MMTLNGMFAEPKPHRINFIKENKQKLKQISSMVNQNTKYLKVDVSKSQSSQTDVNKTVHSSPSKHRTTKKSSAGFGCKANRKGTMAVFLQDRKEGTPASNSSVTTLNKTSQKSVSLSRNQSSQTIDPKKYDQLFHEGTIKYPSNKVLQELAEIERRKANRLDVHVKKDFLKKNRIIKQKSPSPKLSRPHLKETGRGDVKESSCEDDEETTEVLPPSPAIPPPKPMPSSLPPTLNAAEMIRKTTEDHLTYSPRGTATQRSSGGYTTDRAPNNFGDVNGNIASQHVHKINKKNITKKSKKEEDDMLKTILDPLCPPGHIPLPDQERKKTLHMLRVSYAELVRELNLLPVRTDTLRVRQKKIQLENQLNKIEEGIKVFNKSKVYVKIEE